MHVLLLDWLSSCYDRLMQERINDDSQLSLADLVNLIDNWMDRLSQLRQSVARWIEERADQDLRLEDAPAVPMREHLMQQYSIPDRSMPAFKVMKGDQVNKKSKISLCS